MIEGTEKCDDKNSVNSDGCSNCNIDAGYVCKDQPSLCTKTQTPANKNYGITVSMEPLYNTINIFIVLRLEKAYFFTSDEEMMSLIKF